MESFLSGHLDEPAWRREGRREGEGARGRRTDYVLLRHSSTNTNHSMPCTCHLPCSGIHTHITHLPPSHIIHLPPSNITHLPPSTHITYLPPSTHITHLPPSTNITYLPPSHITHLPLSTHITHLPPSLFLVL